ncbi:sugar ABC transporter substrate-binding protein [Corynebacterium testudinoris]|uniref:substrate-binding domain-containing protein n=1 Tax=Corynebacterium testudinoris TaxID=136857 RepID=UPI000640DB28|nr:substrate-binding domain-containing protein [Corynebacterium testudinoris]MBX8994664.1 sugar ABC transporter substrate-binding protein [Corynebacterium testudinoris]
MKFFSRPLAASVAVVVTSAALFLAGCSATGGAPRSTGQAGGGGTVDTERIVVSMVSHGAPGDTFWDLVRKGAEDAARKNNVELRYSADPEVPNQANLIQSAIDARVDGLAVTMPNADALGPAAQRAVDAGIPVVGLNAGMDRYQDFGLSGFFGQEESVAGTRAGERLAQEQAKHVLCVIHEQGNSSQEARCSGVASGLGGGGEVETIYVNGMDLTSVQSTLQAKLAQDRSIDWVMGLVTPVALAAVNSARDAGAEVKIATFDTNAQLVEAVRKGDIAFAIDQQPYLQGYMAVDSLWLAHRNGSTVGGGRPVYTGPSFVDSSNIDTIADAAQAGLR